MAYLPTEYLQKKDLFLNDKIFFFYICGHAVKMFKKLM